MLEWLWCSGRPRMMWNLTDSAPGAVGLCEESGRIWHSWTPFWLLFNSLLLVVFGLVELTFGEAKSDKKNDNFLSWGCTPFRSFGTAILFNSLLFIVFCLVDCCAVVLTLLGVATPNRQYFLSWHKKYSKKSRLMMLLLQSTVPVFAAQS